MASGRSARDDQDPLAETEEEDLRRWWPAGGDRYSPVGTPVVRPRLRLVLGAVLPLALAAGVLWKALTPCVGGHGGGRGSGDPFVMLNEQMGSMGDSYDLLDGRNDEEAREEWLEAARTISAAKAKGQTEEEEARTRRAVRAAMKVSDPGEARNIVKRAMVRSLQNSALKRRELKKLIRGKRGSLKGHKKHKAKKANASQRPLFDMSGGFAGPGGWSSPTQRSDQWEEHYAYCVFDVLSVVNSVARVASDINDAVKTCRHVKPSELLHSPENVHAKVCSVNVFAALGGLSGIATVLSSAANNCASTLVTNIDAACASGIMSLLGSISGFGGGFALVSAACRDKGWHQDIPKDGFPHTVGSSEVYERDYLHKAADGGRRLAEEESTASAPPRQLLFGGGKASTATQCAAEMNRVMWNLASVGLAVDPNCQGETDPKAKGIINKMSRGYCAVDVESAITSFLAVTYTLQFIAVNCVDTQNIEAICGAGVTAVLGGGAGITSDATAIWGTCDAAQREPTRSIITAARRFEERAGAISSAMAGDSADAVLAGRRLARVRDQVEDLKRRFATPEQAWMSIGYDLNNASAVFRKADLPEPDLQMFAALAEEPDEGVGLFGGQHGCSD